MSLIVRYLSEDTRYDKELLHPILKAMLLDVGKPNAKLQPIEDSAVRGVDFVLRSDEVARAVSRYRGTTDVFLLIIDRDGDPGRDQRLKQIEREHGQDIGPRRAFFAEAAHQEIEVWVLAGLDDFFGKQDWKQVRTERDAKECYFLPFLAELAKAEPSLTRRGLAERAAANYQSIRQRCPEDIQHLESRLQEWLSEHAN